MWPTEKKISKNFTSSKFAESQLMELNELRRHTTKNIANIE